MIPDNINYPLKFSSSLYGRIWGSKELSGYLHKYSKYSKIGSCWEIASVEEEVAIVQNGALAGATLEDLINSFGAWLIGKKNLEMFGTGEIESCDRFRTRLLKVQEDLNIDYAHLDSFVVFMCVRGDGQIAICNMKEDIKIGETILIPALSKSVQLESSAMELLEIYLPEKVI